MNNKNKKGYQKVYLNGNCVIDFTKQTIDENKVASGNMFFNKEGKLVEGKDDSLVILQGQEYSYWDNKTPLYHKLGINIPQLTDLSYYYSSNIYKGFPCANYFVLSDQLSSVYSFNGWSYIGGFYLPSQKTTSTNIYSSLAEMVVSSSRSPDLQIYCEDDLSQYIPDTVNRHFVFNCSEIKRTTDDLFDYVIADNKAYILNINYAKLADNVTYIEGKSGYKFSFPDTIENKPVVSLNGYIFSESAPWAASSAGYFTGQFTEIVLPEQLELLGAGCFSNMSSAGDTGIKIKLPATLKSIFGTNEDTTSSNIFCGSYIDLTPNIIDGTFYIPDTLEYCTIGTIRGLLEAGGSAIPSESIYFAKTTNPYAIYIGDRYNSTPNITIEEGCELIGRVPSEVTSINLPSTLKSLPNFQHKSSLTSLTFASSMSHITVIPENFCYYASNLAAIELPEGITRVERCAFQYASKLLDITLPSTLTYIGYDGFYDAWNTTAASKTVRVKAKTPPTLHNTDALTYRANNLNKIIVPKGCLDTYKKASVWSTWASKMEESTEW